MSTGDVVVSDASPLILLARISRLELFRTISARVVAPPEVWREATRHPHAPGATTLLAATWIEVRAPVAPVDGPLGLGEREAIALAKELDAVLVVDDGDARARAMVEGVKIVGTVGVLKRAKQLGHVKLVGPIIEELRANGLRITDAIVAAVRRDLGEA
jgi:predicted nucleic acid-binding protein